MDTKHIATGQFKARCLKLMDEVERTREAITITKKGRPVTKLVPPDAPAKDVFGCLRGVMEIVGDVESPAIPAKDWKISR